MVSALTARSTREKSSGRVKRRRKVERREDCCWEVRSGTCDESEFEVILRTSFNASSCFFGFFFESLNSITRCLVNVERIRCDEVLTADQQEILLPFPSVSEMLYLTQQLSCSSLCVDTVAARKETRPQSGHITASYVEVMLV